jgi:hypothetical protein
MSSSENEDYEGKDPMSPEKITSHEPTAVKRDSSGQEIDESGQAGTDSEEAREKYRKKGMTKVSGGDSYQNTNTGYEGKDPMSPEKITSHEPTAVKRDSTGQEIDESGQAGTDSEEAREKYRKKGMTKVSGGDSYQNTNTGYEGNTTTYSDNRDSSSYGEVKDDVKEGTESTFDKLKAGAKAVGKKITDPDSSLKDEYNQEKSE